MARVRYTALAAQDYRDIWDYVAERDSFQAADRLLEAIDAQAQRLAGWPGIGGPRGKFLPGLRSCEIKKYHLFYVPVEGGMELIRVLHSSRRITRQHFRP